MEYDALPLHLRKQIDDAFSAAASANGFTNERGLVPPAAKRRKLAPAHDDGMQSNYHDETGATSLPVGGGGFIIEDMSGGFIPEGGDEEGGFLPDLGGGFLPEDTNALDGDERAGEEEDDIPQYVPLSSIPKALQILDLPPSDPDVLAIFKSAASGWTSQGSDRAEVITSDNRDGRNGRSELSVRREDWREVCSVLLAPRIRAEDEDAIGSGGFLREDQVEHSTEEPTARQTDDSDVSDDDEYYQEDDEDGDDAEPDPDDDDDDYEASSRRRSTIATRSGAKRLSKGKGKGKRSIGSARSESPSDLSDIARKKMTPRQKTEALKTFALFFPNVDIGAGGNTEGRKQLEKKRIMIKDITRVATIVGEKIKMDEILEMLEAFSSSPDKSISLADFERVVMAAHLV